MSNALASRIAEDFAAIANTSNNVVAATEARRRSSLQALTLRGLPTSREENWKYVNLRPLEKVRFAPPAGPTATSVEPARLPALVAGYARQVFVDGVFAPQLSSSTKISGLTLAPMAGLQTTVPELAESPDLRFALLNEAFATDGANIEV